MGLGDEKALPVGIKKVYPRNSTLIWGTLIHAGLICIALLAAYNSYKEIGSHLISKYFLPHVLKGEIKDAFPWMILIFMVLYSLCSIWRDKEKGLLLTIQQYRTIFIFQAVISNLIFFSKGHHVLIVLNFSLFCLAIFLLALVGVKKQMELVLAGQVEISAFVPPILYKPLERNIALITGYFKEKPANPFIIIFMGLLVLWTFLLILKLEKTAEELANIAYFALLIGIGIEIYQQVRYGSEDEKERD